MLRPRGRAAGQGDGHPLKPSTLQKRPRARTIQDIDLTNMACILKTPLPVGNMGFFSIGKGHLTIFTTKVPTSIDKPATDFVKLNESFLFPKQSFDFLKSCPSPHFLGPSSPSHCLWMGTRHFLTFLSQVPPGFDNLLNRDKIVKASFATLIFPETKKSSFNL